MNDDRRLPAEARTAEALLQWLDSFPRAKIEHRLGLLLTQRRELDQEIRFLQGQLVRYRQYLEDLAPPTADARPAPELATEQRQFPPKRLAVLRLLGEAPGRAWRLADIRQTLINRGWLEDSDRARHALQVTLLAMAKRGELEKPATGFYRMANGNHSLESGTDEPGGPPSRGSVPGESEGGAAQAQVAPPGPI